MTPLLAFLLALLGAPGGRAIVIEIFSDPGCTTSVGNSSVYTGYAGICNTATTPDSGLSIGIDFCTPTRVTMSVYRYHTPETNEVWGDYFFCSSPDQADTTIDLQLNACTAVLPCSTCPQQFFRLLDTQCDAPAPVYIFQQDRGGITRTGNQACQGTGGLNGDLRFQSREIVSGICNVRTVTNGPNSALNSGTNCGFQQNSCSRYRFDSLSLLASPGQLGFVVNAYTGDDCLGTPLMTFPSVPIQGSTSTTCQVFQQWSTSGTQPLARHGLRAYPPQLYTTVRSNTPTPSQTPSQTPTPSTTRSLVQAASAQALSNEQAALIGVGVTAFLLIAGLGASLA